MTVCNLLSTNIVVILVSVYNHKHRADYSIIYYMVRYSYTIALSDLFELYMRGRHLNHETKLSGLNVCLECTIQMNHDKAVV